MPELGEEYEVFCGRYPSPEAFKAAYGVEEVHGLPARPCPSPSPLALPHSQPRPHQVRHLRELPAWLEEQLGAEGTLYLLHGKNSDSGNYALPATFPGDDAFAGRKDQTSLFEAAAEARVTKSAAEVEVLRYVNWVRSAGTQGLVSKGALFYPFTSRPNPTPSISGELDGARRGDARGHSWDDGIPAREPLPAPHVHARRLPPPGATC